MLEEKVKELSERQEEDLEKKFTEKMDEFIGHLKFQQSTIDGLRRQNDDLVSQLKAANEMQTLYDE